MDLKRAKSYKLSSFSLEICLRKLGDSNPRYGYPYGSLANCWFQPLTHPSRVRYRIAKHCLSNAGAKLAIYFRPAKFIGIFFLKIFLFAVFSLFIWRFLRFSRPKATIHPYHHRTTRRHRRLRQRGRARDCRSAHFVSSRGCKIFSPRKRIFSFLSRHRGRQARTKERGQLPE